MSDGSAETYIYSFQQGSGTMGDLLGGKGANLAEMTRVGLPVPPGFVITTDACRAYLRGEGAMPPGLEEAVYSAMAGLESEAGRKFGDAGGPLLVSVRSGAPVSMPGMMDTILNLGLNDETVQGLARQTGDERFALDCYRRLIQMYGNVVLGMEHAAFEKLLEQEKRRRGVVFDTDLPAEALNDVVASYKDHVRSTAGVEFPQDPSEQLMGAIMAVFDSWNNERARVYRRIHRIAEDLGTAVNVQAMVFGNMGGDDSGTGVLFTRDPSTGENRLYGEFLFNAQGEDVVAGIRTPRPLSELAEGHPGLHDQIAGVAAMLEKHYKDMQDIEFTVERGKLYILQTRTGKRTAAAAVKIAHDMAEEGLIDRETALLRIPAHQVTGFLHESIDTDTAGTPLARGLPASPGAAVGVAVFDSDEAEDLGSGGTPVILVRPETTPDDIHGMAAARGILTSRGGMTCHAAIVARGMGKPCIVGCEQLTIDPSGERAVVAGHVINKGDRIAVDGTAGRIYAGEVPLVEPELSEEFQSMLAWSDQVRRLGIRANADTPEDARRALEFGAEGIGLCRTEHMFMGADRLPVVQKMILADDGRERREALDELLAMQEDDFEQLLSAMAGRPVTIRLLDPPLHEFLPQPEDLLAAIHRLEAEGAPRGEISRRRVLLGKVRSLMEANPMLGHRGCRLGITYPEIYEMQARAIFTAAARLAARGIDTSPEIMIPLVGHVNELAFLRRRVEETARAVEEETGASFPVVIGTMIEIPRACLTADDIAGEAEFFSFGTNDLTQTVFGFSRDDAEAKFLHHYLERDILPDNPFVTIDEGGVGMLVETAVAKGRQRRPELTVGICGEHGGDPASIDFCHRAGLDYVSCSPFRVPVARLAAAQAAVRRRGDNSSADHKL